MAAGVGTAAMAAGVVTAVAAIRGGAAGVGMEDAEAADPSQFPRAERP